MKCARKWHNMSPTCTYRQSLILRWKLLNPPQNLLKILPMIVGALHRLNTPPFSPSGRFSHFRALSQIFDTGFGRLSPLSPFPSHHSPLALYARSHHPSLALLRAREFPNPPLSLGKACGGGRVRRMNRSRSFAVFFDKLSRIERQSRPKYKLSAVPNWLIRRTLHAPNLIIWFGTCKVRRLNRGYLMGIKLPLKSRKFFSHYSK